MVALLCVLARTLSVQASSHSTCSCTRWRPVAAKVLSGSQVCLSHRLWHTVLAARGYHCKGGIQAHPMPYRHIHWVLRGGVQGWQACERCGEQGTTLTLSAHTSPLWHLCFGRQHPTLALTRPQCAHYHPPSCCVLLPAPSPPSLTARRLQLAAKNEKRTCTLFSTVLVAVITMEELFCDSNGWDASKYTKM